MHSFKDTQGGEWKLEITFGDIRRVRDRLDLDISKILDGGEETERIGDPITLVDAIYLILKPEADKRSISDEEFGSRLNGETLEQAAEALTGALIDFFPPARRELYRRAINAGKRLSQATISQAQEALEKLEVQSLTSKKLATDSPESSASDPANSTS